MLFIARFYVCAAPMAWFTAIAAIIAILESSLTFIIIGVMQLLGTFYNFGFSCTVSLHLRNTLVASAARHSTAIVSNAVRRS